MQLKFSAADPQSYVPHAVHAPARAYSESNCWLDVIVELLHARGHEPAATLGVAAGLDLDGDQLSFLKPRESDLSLHGLEVHEVQPWRPLTEQAGEHLEQGRTLMLEADAWWLPDTAGTTYGTAHRKTTIAVQALDADAERLHYFHGRGLYELTGEDYRAVLPRPDDPARLPPYVEVVRLDPSRAQRDQQLVVASVELLRGHLAGRPQLDPFSAVTPVLARLVDELPQGGPGLPQDVTFATARMGGSAAELLAHHAGWAFGARAEGVLPALERVVAACTAVSFRIARRRPFPVDEVLRPAAQGWVEALERLDELAA